MRNGAYSLAVLSTMGGFALLFIAEQGSAHTALGTVLLLIALLLAGLGKGIDLLGYVHEGAAESETRE